MDRIGPVPHKINPAERRVFLVQVLIAPLARSAELLVRSGPGRTTFPARTGFHTKIIGAIMGRWQLEWRGNRSVAEDLTNRGFEDTIVLGHRVGRCPARREQGRDHNR